MKRVDTCELLCYYENAKRSCGESNQYVDAERQEVRKVMKMNEKQIIVKTMRLLLEASEVAKTNAKKYDEDSFQRGFLIGKYNAYNNVFNLLERELKYNNDEQREDI